MILLCSYNNIIWVNGWVEAFLIWGGWVFTRLRLIICRQITSRLNKGYGWIGCLLLGTEIVSSIVMYNLGVGPWGTL